MFNFVKIQALFNATLMMGYYPNFNSFTFNEDVNEVQNVHNKHWEFKKETIVKNSNDTIVVGVSLTTLSILI